MPHRTAAAVGKRALTAKANTAARGDRSNRFHLVVWYPAENGATTHADVIGPPSAPLFSAGTVASDAPIAASPKLLPLVVLSHGTGGSAMQMAWLGTRLAAAGFVAAAMDHPGNSFAGAYTTQGFALWWLRATDLSQTIDAVLGDAPFATRIDPRRIAAAGFSIGGATVLVAAGGRVDLVRLHSWCKTRRTDICSGPPELPTLAADIGRLAQKDAAFRAELFQSGRSYRDRRIRAAFAIAPAMGPAFDPQSLQTISSPIAIVAGFGDANIAVQDNAIPLALAIPNASLHVFARPVSHYTFLDECLPAGQAQLPRLCKNTSGRHVIHEQAARMAAEFFERALTVSSP